MKSKNNIENREAGSDCQKRLVRFLLEERGGIVAIYDTSHPEYEVTAGCQADYPWVVAHWNGSPVMNESGGIKYWEVEPRWTAKAKETLELLNSLANDQGEPRTPC